MPHKQTPPAAMSDRITYDGEIIVIPESITVCPECNHQLHIDIYEWDSETLIPTDGGFHVYCISEEADIEQAEQEMPDDDEYIRQFEHRYWQCDWQPVIDKITAWAEKNVRVSKQYAEPQS